MSDAEQDRAETIDHWVEMWTNDWKLTIEGISKRTGLTRREVFDFMQLVFRKVDREHTGIVLEQILAALVGGVEEEEPKRFG